MFRTVVIENCRQIVLKISKARFKAAVFESCCSKLPRKPAPQSCSCFPLVRKLCKAAPQSCSPKLLPEAAPQSCSPALLPKAAILQTCSKAILQSGSRNLRAKVATKSCSPKLKLSVKLLPKAAVLQSNCSAKSFWKASLSCSPKLLLKATPQSGSPKLLPKVVIESCSGQLLLKIPLKLLPKAASESCFLKLLPKAIVLQKLFVNAAAQLQSCSPQLFPKAALQGCYRKPLPKAAPQSGRRRVQQAANFAEVRVRTSTETINSAHARQAKAIAIARSGLGRT